MGKKIDMTGWIMSKHGVPDSKLTVLYELPKKNKKIYWHCKCDCGNECDIQGSNLRNGNTKSCGCLQKERVSEFSLKDLVNQRFGKLLVLYKTEEKRGKEIVWHCKCDCGNECDIIGSALRKGYTKSCGCYRREISSKLRYGKESPTTINLIGQTFGYLTVIEKTNKRDSDGNIIWKCKCKCGNEYEVRGKSLREGNTKSCGCLRSIGELKISQILNKNNILFTKEKIFKDCALPSKRLARFDFYVNNQYIIEYDGIQHFKTSAGWNTEEKFQKTQKHDNIKNEYCKKHNIPLIRIPYTHLEDICLEDLIPETSQFLLKQEE